jgi:hypothetical protein
MGSVQSIRCIACATSRRRKRIKSKQFGRLMFRVSIGVYELCYQENGLPDTLSEYQQRVALSEDCRGLSSYRGSTRSWARSSW